MGKHVAKIVGEHIAMDSISGVKIPELEITSWNHLVKVADRLNVGNGLVYPYGFRGQEDISWGLTPTLHRAVTKGDARVPLPASDELLRIESALTYRFRPIAATHLPPAVVAATKGEIGWWLLMRHYGAPARLLDWTASFYVALYFAVARFPDRDAALYIVHINTLNEAMKLTHGDAAEFPRGASASKREFQRDDAPHVLNVMVPEKAMLDRMVAQQALFMVGRNVSTEFEAVLAHELPEVTNPPQQTLLKLRIKAGEKPIIMRHLRAMNLTAGSLFPGLDGIGRQFEELARGL